MELDIVEEKAEEKEDLSPREKAEKKIRQWADVLELDTKRDLFSDVMDQLIGVVEKERLTFDEETEVFTYQLLKPVGGKKLITIRETTFEEKKALQKFKDNEEMDAAGMMMAKHTNLSTGDVLQLKTRDQKRINAVIMGFLAQ